MRILLGLFVAAFLMSPLPVRAEETLGRVEAIYHEAARGVLAETRYARTTSAVRWADVAVGDRKVLARLPAGMKAARGDIIAVRLAEPQSTQIARVLPATAVSRVVPREETTFAGQPGAASVGR